MLLANDLYYFQHSHKVYKTQILIHVGRTFRKSVCDISYTLCIKQSSLALLNLQAEFMTY